MTRDIQRARETLQYASNLVRGRAYQLEVNKKVEEHLRHWRNMNKDGMLYGPEFTIKLRSHTVWEKSNIQFACTIQAWPRPTVCWYKNMVAIEGLPNDGKYKIENRFGIHTLEILDCQLEDTGQYSICAINAQGENASYASLVVKRYRGDLGEDYITPGYVFDFPLFVPSGVMVDIHLLNKFDVTFATEGQTLSLGCNIVLHPPTKLYQPEVLWFLNGKQLHPDKWVNMVWSEGQATLTLSHVNKEDEGLYTLRAQAGRRWEKHSAYVFVRDAELTGNPGAPLDVEYSEVNKDYIIISWKQPSDNGGSTIIGYFIDKREVGTDHWLQCNDTPVKFARYPITGLVEGRSYEFRVRAVNRCGISHPSRVSAPIASMDPSDKMKNVSIAPWTGQIIVTEEEPEEGRIPGAPTDLRILEATKNYIVLAWKPPEFRGNEGVMYFVEKCAAGSTSWCRINDELPLKSPRLALFDLEEGKSYAFRIRACNSNGVGTPSDVIEHASVGDRLEVPAPPGEILTSRNTGSSAIIWWEPTPTTSELVGYYIDAKLSGSDHWEPCHNKPVMSTRFAVHGLHEGQTYTFRVKAVNAAGLSDYSPESESITILPAISAPSSPHGIVILESVKDSMVLGWKAPRATGGLDVTGYYVDYQMMKNTHEGPWQEANLKPIAERMFRVMDLKENSDYRFRVRAVNMAGVGPPSDISDCITCEEWTLAVPGPPYSLQTQEARRDSVVLLWHMPVYVGRSPVTGYYVDKCEADKVNDYLQWQAVNEVTVKSRFLKVTGLVEGRSYVFRVRAENRAGVGKASEMTDAVLAETRPGTKDLVVDVDDDGHVYMIFEGDQLPPDSKLLWSKNYEDPLDPSRVDIETKGNKTKVVFKGLDENDLGVYSCLVSGTDGVSSSYNLDEDELKRLLEKSYNKKHPVVPLLSKLQLEVLDEGQVRFWIQAEKLSAQSKGGFVLNDSEVHDDNRIKTNCDPKTGIVEMIVTELKPEDEGTYTVQIQDGRAKNEATLVLIEDDFKNLLKESAFHRAEYLRKQGPHFVEYLSWEVTSDCNVILKSKVANTKKDTIIVWYKDEREVQGDIQHDEQSGVCTFHVPQLAKKDAGLYRMSLWDDRGKDSSTLEVTEEAFDAMMKEICRISAISATPLKLQSTEEGIKLYSFVTYYPEELKVSWTFRNEKLASKDKIRSGIMSNQLWLQINEPTEKDQGKYALELFDGKEKHMREMDLTGDVFQEAYQEFQRLKQAAIAERNRARVTGGLPDVVTIQKGKTVNLRCNIWGDPVPEVTWFRNEREISSDNHVVLSYDKGKHASFIINKIETEDSGKYSISVKNKYGSETGDVTVSVYIPLEEEHGQEDEG
uniref:myomesin-1-like n=1 Tax=Myxine glutinosa TaxID=7769 RepID=UPI00358F10D3